jgi:2-phosphosulfolactate phosphatase
VKRSFVIDALTERGAVYRSTHAIVVIDVFRATTVIITALAGGHSVYPVGSLEDAFATARRLRQPLLAGEQAGITPDGFDLSNSPAALSRLPGHRPLVLLSSAGTVLLTNCRGGSSVYVACLRNLGATVDELTGRHHRVALIGAGTNGEPRAEDQMACAWIGQRLLERGYEVEDGRTRAELEGWSGASVEVIRDGLSASWLRSAGHQQDIDFVLSHIDDVYGIGVYNGQQVSLVTPEREEVAKDLLGEAT